MANRTPILVVAVLALAGGFMWWFTRSEPNPDEPVDQETVNRRSIPPITSRPGHVGSSVCQECHQDQHASWHKTYHRTMTQVASPQTIQAKFEGQTMESWGQQFKFDRKGDDFLVTMPDLEWQAQLIEQRIKPAEFVGTPPMNQYKVVMATGSHNAQHYWIEGVKAEQPVRIPFVFLMEDQRLVPSPDAWLHDPDWWKQTHYFEHKSGLWNRACSSCHSLAPRPGFDLDTGEMRTEIAELGISCESCHGPGLEHASLQNSKRLGIDATHGVAQSIQKEPAKDRADAKTDTTIVNPAKLNNKLSTHLCGRCHTEYIPRYPVDYMVEGIQFRPGKMLGEWVNISYFGDGKAHWISETYWPDGTQRVSGDEFLGTTASPCYIKGTMSCVSCHSMHDSDPDHQLGQEMQTSQACLQCHKTIKDNVTQHTHHAADSSGSNCYNCHMPHTAYAFLRAQRTHRIDSPNVDNSVKFGKPNACNLCHLDKSLQWTSSRLKEWYGVETKSDLKPEDKDHSAAAKWLISGNGVQRGITGWHFGWQPALDASGTDWQPRLLADELVDRYSAVRRIASRALKAYPDFKTLEYDYIGNPADRQKIRSEVIKKWLDSKGSKEKLHRVLGDTESIDEHLKRLLDKRDTDPIGLFE
jgi:predicted CXXCH cytochrome family protein